MNFIGWAWWVQSAFFAAWGAAQHDIFFVFLSAFGVCMARINWDIDDAYKAKEKKDAPPD